MPRACTDRLPVLVSYAFLRDSEALSEAVMRAKGLELLLDCGAFTAMNAGYEIALADYVEFVRRWEKRLFGYMALDKLQDPVQTDRNLREMLGAGLRPIPVHVFGDDGARMDELFEQSEWVALGGLRRPHRGSAPLSYIKLKMEWAKGRKVHWLGYVRSHALRAFRPYSSDCSSFAAGVRYGNVQMYAGRGLWKAFTYRSVMEEKPYLQPEIRQLLDDYGIPVEHFVDERYWRNTGKAGGMDPRESVVMRLPCRSWVRYVMEMRRETGVRLFIASIPSSLPHVLDAFDWWKEKYANEGVRHDKVRRLSPVDAGAGRSRVSA